MSETLRIGFVGGGFITRFHIQSLVGVRDCVVAGVASRTRQSAGEAAGLARELGVGPAARAFDSTEEMAADDSVDALWICATNDTRVPVMKEIREGCRRRSTSLRGIACEKPLARTLAEAAEVAELAREIGAPTAYLEDMVFAPHLQRGKEVIWRRAAAIAGRPYLARASEEHGGPHSPWFWLGPVQGGGVLLDMMCHSLEAGRWLLTEPAAARSSLTPVSIQATATTLKWAQPRYADELRARFGEEVDYRRQPSEDYASATLRWRTAEGQEVLSETTTSWSYVGAGLRHTFELLGPEYSMLADLSRTGLEVFLSRQIRGEAGEDLVEKQNAEQGLMPVAPDETAYYGYVGENRHVVGCFRRGTAPELSFDDGLEVVRLMMAAYRACETSQAVDPRDPSLESFVPQVARGAWQPTA